MDDEYIRDGKIHYVLIHYSSGDDRIYTSILTRTVFEPEPRDTHTQTLDSWHTTLRDAKARSDTLNKEFEAPRLQREGEK